MVEFIGNIAVSATMKSLQAYSERNQGLDSLEIPWIILI